MNVDFIRFNFSSLTFGGYISFNLVEKEEESFFHCYISKPYWSKLLFFPVCTCFILWYLFVGLLIVEQLLKWQLS